MKTVREILVIPFYALGFAIFLLSIVVDLAGCAVALVGAAIEGGGHE